MVYINDILVTEELDRQIVEQTVKSYLFLEKLIIVNKDNKPMSEQEFMDALTTTLGTIKLTAIPTNSLLREFKVGLHAYIEKVENYIEDTRETEKFSTVTASFVQVTEALLEFNAVAKFLQKDLINHQQIQDISQKALEQAELGNNEYILDLLEYELLPILHQFIDETNEEM